MLARIIAIADAFDAMTSPRRYREAALTFTEARAEITREAGAHFDPELARLFVRHATPELLAQAHAAVVVGAAPEAATADTRHIPFAEAIA
jgi:HD-GYP domain-containing protein (c-di-GMP phosphodiesterase class II)